MAEPLCPECGGTGRSYCHGCDVYTACTACGDVLHNCLDTEDDDWGGWE